MLRRSKLQKQTLLLDQSIQDVCTMLECEARMFQTACAHLLRGEPASGPSLERQDEDINAGERMVRRAVLEHLALNPSQDLPASLVLLNVVVYAERIGDYSKELWDLGEKGVSLTTARYVEQLEAISQQIQPMFEWCVKAFREESLEDGERVMERKREVEKTTDAVLAQLLQDTDLPTAEGVLYALASRYMRRVSAHLSNIASSVVAPLDKIGFDDQESDGD